MVFLVCDKCGGYYELQEGESPEDFKDICECGGKLKYVENLNDIQGAEETPKKAKPLLDRLKGWWDKQNKPIKAAIIIGLLFVGVIIIFGMIELYSADPGFQKYNSLDMSFQYPQGWYVDNQASNTVKLEETSTRYSSIKHFLWIVVYHNKDSANEAMDWGFPSGNPIKTGNINGIIYNYSDNAINNTNTTPNLYFYYFEKNDKYVFIHAGVNDTSIVEKVILTFN